MTSEAKRFFDDLGTPTAAEVPLVEKALVAGRANLSGKCGSVFLAECQKNFKENFHLPGTFVCSSETIKQAFELARKAIEE